MNLEELQRVMKNEGDEFRFTHLYLTCVGIRNKMFGHWCGYVVIPSDFGHTVDENQISVHGGVTYNGETYANVGDSNDILIGFDANHFNDITEYSLTIFKNMMEVNGSSYKDIDFIKSECISMAEQITELYPDYKKIFDRDNTINNL